MVVDQLAVEPDRLEDLGAAVGVDVEMPIFESTSCRPLRAPSIARRDASSAEIRSRAGAAVQVGDRLEHQVGVDRARAVADQRGEVVDLARLAGLDDERGLQARAAADQVLVDRGGGEQRRDRHARRGRSRGR